MVLPDAHGISPAPLSPMTQPQADGSPVQKTHFSGGELTPAIEPKINFTIFAIDSLSLDLKLINIINSTAEVNHGRIYGY
jgi:hypothetical protein